MKSVKADAIRFLNLSIERYRRQLDGLKPKETAISGVVDYPANAREREQLNALIDDARRLLSQIKGS